MNFPAQLLLIGTAFFAGNGYCQSQIPGVGSLWEKQIRYISSDTLGKKDFTKVLRVENGTPIFSVSLGGYDGVLFQSGDDVVGVVGTCAASHVVGGQPPNVCGWTPCTTQVGQTIKRKFIAVTPLNSCAPVEGFIEHTGVVRTEIEVAGQRYSVVKTPSGLKVPSIGTAKWTAYIAANLGEVHAESPGRETVYSKVAVNLETAAVQSLTVSNSIAIKVTEEGANSSEKLIRKFPDKPLIVAVGDSLTLGMGVAATQTYPAVLQQKMANVEILKMGIAGTTVAELADSIATLNQLKPDVILINVGGNDMMRGATRAALRTKLIDLVQALKTLCRNVVLLGLEIDSTFPYSGVYIDVARESGVEILPNLLAGVYKNAAMMSKDGMHPNEDGYAQMARNVEYRLGELKLMASVVSARQ